MHGGRGLHAGTKVQVYLAIVQIFDSHLRFRYNLGSRENDVMLSHVNVSDGEWHVALVSRVGAWASLQLDSRFGRFFNQTVGLRESHSEIRVAQTGLVGGGSLPMLTSGDVMRSEDDFRDSCLDDFRFNGHWMPLLHADVTPAFFTSFV